METEAKRAVQKSELELEGRAKQSKARARLEEGDRQGDKDTGKEKKAKKNAITKQIGN